MRIKIRLSSSSEPPKEPFVMFSGMMAECHLFFICSVGFYMVAVERQAQNREKMMAEALAAGDRSEDV